MPMIPDVVHGIPGQCSRVGNRQLPLGGEKLVGHTGRGYRFLNGVFTPFTWKAAELDLSMRLDSGQNLQKSILPFT
ncbi:MAG: hypothetical protein ABSB74_03625 [Tepidisphaeraceae bacterium]